jgi:hypothetical protein
VLVGWLEVSLLVRWLLGWILGLSLPPLPASTPLQQQTLSVLIPARNEAATLPHLLEALSSQILRPDEVIVVDDDSSDGTAAVARQSAGTLALKVIQPPPLPEGWCGKTWALHHGVQASRGMFWFFWTPTPSRPRISWSGCSPNTSREEGCFRYSLITAPRSPTSSSRCFSAWWG